LSWDISKVIVRFCHKIGHKMFCELTKCCEIILGPKIVARLFYDRLWTGPQACIWSQVIAAYSQRSDCNQMLIEASPNQYYMSKQKVTNMAAEDVFIKHATTDWLATNVPDLHCNIHVICTGCHRKQSDSTTSART